MPDRHLPEGGSGGNLLLHAKPNSRPVTPRKFKGFPVYVNLYDLTHKANKALRHCGFAIYHGGIEVHQGEYSFGGVTPPEVLRWDVGRNQGIFRVPPRKAFGVKYRKSVFIGFTKLNRAEVKNMLEDLSEEWPSDSYNTLSRNCNHFCDVFSQQLTGRKVPRYVNRPARVAGLVSCRCMSGPPGKKNKVAPMEQRIGIIAALQDERSPSPERSTDAKDRDNTGAVSVSPRRSGRRHESEDICIADEEDETTRMNKFYLDNLPQIASPLPSSVVVKSMSSEDTSEPAYTANATVPDAGEVAPEEFSKRSPRRLPPLEGTNTSSSGRLYE